MRISVACHIHSDWSYDGSLPLEWISSELGKNMRVLLITEHDRGFDRLRFERHRSACAMASSERTLLIPGIEYSDPSNTIHILVWGMNRFLGEGLATKELLTAVSSENAVAVLAHPARRNAWRVFDPSWSEMLSAVEIWNRKTDGWAPSRSAMRLAHEFQIPAFCGMDFHNRSQIFPLSIELDIPNEPSEESVLKEVRKGRFSATAFGFRLHSNSLNPGIEGLRILEFMRRSVAFIYRQSCRSLISKSMRKPT